MDIHKLDGRDPTLTERLAETAEVVRLALSLARDCGDAYRNSPPDLRQLWHEAVFERIVVKGRRVARITYREPFASLLSGGFVSTRSRRRTGIEPAWELSPPHRF